MAYVGAGPLRTDGKKDLTLSVLSPKPEIRKQTVVALALAGVAAAGALAILVKRPGAILKHAKTVMRPVSYLQQFSRSAKRSSCPKTSCFNCRVDNTFTPKQVDYIIKMLKPVDRRHSCIMEIDGRRLVIIGTRHDVYERFESVLKRLALKRSLAFFAEGTGRDEEAERRLIAYTMRKSYKGYFFGLENPKIILLTNVSFKSILPYRWVPYYWDYWKEEICYQIFASPENRKVFHQLAEITGHSLMKEMDRLISRYALKEDGEINRYELFKELKALPSYDHEPIWSVICKGLSHELLKEAPIGEKQKNEIAAAINNPQNHKFYRKYSNNFLLGSRNQTFVATILNTVPTLPLNVTSVACMGDDHVSGVVNALKKESNVKRLMF